MENQVTPKDDLVKSSERYTQMTDEEVHEELKKICILSNPMEKYRLSRQLGRGSGGFTFLVMDHKTFQKVAIKKTETREVPYSKGLLLNEIHLLHDLNYEKLVSYVEVFYQEDPWLGNLFWTVMEYMEG